VRETGLREDGLRRGEIRQVVRSEERGGLGAECWVGSNGEPLNGRQGKYELDVLREQGHRSVESCCRKPAGVDLEEFLVEIFGYESRVIFAPTVVP
jgi:hypothetical protein